MSTEKKQDIIRVQNSIDAIKEFISQLPDNMNELSVKERVNRITDLSNVDLNKKYNTRLLMGKFDFLLIHELHKKHPDIVATLIRLHDSIPKLPAKLKDDSDEFFFNNFAQSVRLLKDWDPIELINKIDLDKPEEVGEYIKLFRSFDKNEKLVFKKNDTSKKNLAKVFVRAQMYGFILDSDIDSLKKEFIHCFRGAKEFDKYVNQVYKNLRIDDSALKLHNFFLGLKTNSESLTLNRLKETFAGVISDQDSADVLLPKIISVLKRIPVLKPNFHFTQHDIEKIAQLYNAVNDSPLEDRGKLAFFLLYLQAAVTDIEVKADPMKNEIPYSKTYQDSYVDGVVLRTAALNFVDNISAARKVIKPIIDSKTDHLLTGNEPKITPGEVKALKSLDERLQDIQRNIYEQVKYNNVNVSYLRSKKNQIQREIDQTSLSEEKPNGIFSKIIHAITQIFSRKPSPFVSALTQMKDNVARKI